MIVKEYKILNTILYRAAGRNTHFTMIMYLPSARKATI